MEMLRRIVEEADQRSHAPIFVKVGANDGVTGDPFGDAFLKSDHWKGLLIEPVPYCAQRLAAIYANQDRFVIEQTAISDLPGKADFYYVSESARHLLPQLPDWYNQLGSFNRSHIVKHLDGVLEPFIVTISVAVDTLLNVVRKHRFQRVALLHVDVEGSDLAVLRSANLAILRPFVIFVEHRHLSDTDKTDMLSLLHSCDYTIRDTGSDYFAILRDAPRPFNTTE